VLLEQPSLEAFLRASGWQLKAEGLCRDEVCIPLHDGVDLPAVAQQLRMPLVHDDATDTWAIGPPAAAHALPSAVAPDLVLPDLNGNDFALRTLQGHKVLLLAWASW
jgi:hypothetical protein